MSTALLVPLDTSKPPLGKHVAGSLASSPACSVKFEFPPTNSIETVVWGLLQSRLAAASARRTSPAAVEEVALMSDWTPAQIGSLPWAHGMGTARTRGLSPAECAAYATLQSAEAAAAEKLTPENAAAVAAAAAELDSAKSAALAEEGLAEKESEVGRAARRVAEQARLEPPPSPSPWP